MLPIRLNFLSPEKRKHLNKMTLFQFLKNILEVSLVFLCISGIALLGGQSVLQDYFNTLTTQIVAINNQYSETNKEIKEINKVIDETGKIQGEYVLWSEKLSDITKIVPANIYLSSLYFDYAKKEGSMSGFAKDRNDLLTLQKQLEQTTWIKSVNLPLSQLAEKENIQFSVVMKMK